jgi:hypothetical protein
MVHHYTEDQKDDEVVVVKTEFKPAFKGIINPHPDCCDAPEEEPIPEPEALFEPQPPPPASPKNCPFVPPLPTPAPTDSTPVPNVDILWLVSGVYVIGLATGFLLGTRFSKPVV